MSSNILLYGQDKFLQNLKIQAEVYKNSLKSNTYEKIQLIDLNYMSHEKRKINCNPLTLIGKMTNTSCPIDRTGYIEHYNMKYAPIPKYDENFNKNYDDIALEQAKRIWDSNDIIDVLFSGGIDSIAVCCALIQTKPSNKQLRILCSKSAEIEFPGSTNLKLFKEFIVKKDNKELIDSKNLNPNNAIVTGEPGYINQIGGILIKDDTDLGMYNVIGENIDNISWIRFWNWQDKFFNDFTNRYTLSQQHKENFNLLLQNHFKQAPFQIKTLNDMRWWLMFVFRDNWATYAFLILIILNTQILPKKIDLSKWIPFFGHKDWQLWSMKKHIKKTQDSYPYKEDAKKFIKKTIDLHDFIDNKQKEVSVRNIQKNATQILRTWSQQDLVILDDGRLLKTQELLPETIEEIVKI